MKIIGVMIMMMVILGCTQAIPITPEKTSTFSETGIQFFITSISYTYILC